MVKDNVRCVFDDIAQITEKGLRTSTGEEIEVDVIIAATGFDVRFIPWFTLQGSNGVSLEKEWAESPMCYP